MYIIATHRSVLLSTLGLEERLFGDGACTKPDVDGRPI